MLKVRTLDTVNLGSDTVVGLSEKQANLRARSLKAVDEKSGTFQVLKPIMFKRGEVLEVDKLPKAFLNKVEMIDAPKAEKDPAAPKKAAPKKGGK